MLLIKNANIKTMVGKDIKNGSILIDDAGKIAKIGAKIIEVTDDAAVAKAEAEYNRAMNDIEAKDNIFDMELKNIDTEHNALQTEYDVIKGVIDKTGKLCVVNRYCDLLCIKIIVFFFNHLVHGYMVTKYVPICNNFKIFFYNRT